MPMISMEWTYNLPNEYLVDHSFTAGKTRTTEYDGPDKIYLIINNETGKEEFGPITAEEKADGRPIPEGCRYVEVDCTTNPLVCQLKGPVIDEAEEDPEIDTWHPQSPDIPGYERYSYGTPLLPRDIYNKMELSVDENDNITIPVFTPVEILFGGALTEMPNWDYAKKIRNHSLSSSDGAISEDMPVELKEKWKTYRQLLRDFPATMQAHNVPPGIALMMLPLEPGAEIPPEDGPY
jgi:hypothetical protein